MRDPLILACAQPRSDPDDLAGTVDRHAALVDRAATLHGASLVIFPELSLTGYDLQTAPIAPDDHALAPIRSACAATKATALVGAPTRSHSGAEHISTLAVTADAVATVYRKMWPGDDERGRFVAGEAPGVVEVDGWRVGLAICRDIGVEDHVTLLCQLDLDLVVASVVDRPEHHDEQRRRCRAIAERVGVPVAVASGAGAHRSGFDETAGRSFVLDRNGAVIAEASDAVGALAVATLSSGA